jgi:hypothetical protein
MGKIPEQQAAGLTSVFAIMSNFESYVLEEKHDLEALPQKLREKGLEELAKYADRGMRVINRDKARLKAPDLQTIQQTCEKIRHIHAQAYDWQPPPLHVERLGITSMREYVKRWITEWDLTRLDPTYTVDLQSTTLEQSYNEDATLEASAEEEPIGETE